MKYFSLTITLLLVMSLQAIPGSAIGRGASDWEDYENKPDEDYVEGEKWKETEIKIPPYPDDDDLIDLQLDDPSNRFQYFIDEKSLSVTEKDYVVRYTMVIESNRGTRNIFYEGIRCSTEEYKTYAFGTGKGKLHARKKPEWKRISESGYKRLRTDLIQYYFCEWGLLRKLGVILNRMKHPASSFDE